MSESEATQPEYRTERWVYLGVFKGVKVPKVACFRTADGERRAYKAGAWNRHLAVGCVYEIEASDQRAKVEAATWTRDRAEDYEALKMEARAEEIRMERKALEAKARTGNSPELDELLEHVEQYAVGLVSVAGKEALVTLLTKTVWQARRGK